MLFLFHDTRSTLYTGYFKFMQIKSEKLIRCAVTQPPESGTGVRDIMACLQVVKWNHDVSMD